MVLDGLRGYIQLANGLTDVTRKRAKRTAKALVAQGEAGVGAVVPGPVRKQVSTLTDDLLATSKANRELLVNLVRGEVEHSVSRLGLVSSQEVDSSGRRARALERRVEELEQELSAVRSRATTAGSGATKRTARPSNGRRTTAKKSTAKKSTAKKSTAKKTTAKKTTAKKTTARGTTAKKSTAKKSTAKKSTARGTTAKRSTAKRSTAKKSTPRKSVAKSTAARRSAATTSTARQSPA